MEADICDEDEEDDYDDETNLSQVSLFSKLLSAVWFNFGSRYFLNSYFNYCHSNIPCTLCGYFAWQARRPLRDFVFRGRI